MVVSTTEHQAGAESMGDIGKDATNGRGRLKSDVNVLQESVIGGAIIWLRVLCGVDVNVENSERGIHQFSDTNNG